ncbi:hypothetical protein QR680_004854 [Steinernema hermaphroditum]|uniref:Uncharacterized protein n=1 Tax=Steinernema hermaphroditum TaxID=289476 RepID=A0AA39HQ16_9BILA|nr:hypothetical protein QR680_004854 [Steinernema hermaphroditum]
MFARSRLHKKAKNQVLSHPKPSITIDNFKSEFFSALFSRLDTMKCCIRGEAVSNPGEEAFGGYQKCNDGYESELRTEDFKWAAVKEINAQSRDLLFRAPVCTIREEILVPGLAYVLELELVQTDCLQRLVDYEKARKKPCTPKKNARWFHYTVEIWLKDPESVSEITIKQFYELTNEL